MTRRRVRHNKRRGTFLKLGFCLYLIICIFSIITLRAAVVDLEYKLGDIEKMRAELTTERMQVSAQRANYYSTEKIEKVAMKRLKMRLPDREKVYFVKRTSPAGPFRASMK